MSDMSLPTYTYASAMLVTLREAKRNEAYKASKTREDWHAFRRQVCADIYQLGQAFLPDKNVVGLIDGRIFAFWDSDVFVSVNQRAKTLIYMCDSFFVACQGNNLDRLYSYYGSEEKLKRHSL